MSKRLAMIALSRALESINQLSGKIIEFNDVELNETFWKLYDQIIELDEQYNNTENPKKLREIRRKVEAIQDEFDRIHLLVEKEIH